MPSPAPHTAANLIPHQPQTLQHRGQSAHKGVRTAKYGTSRRKHGSNHRLNAHNTALEAATLHLHYPILDKYELHLETSARQETTLGQNVIRNEPLHTALRVVTFDGHRTESSLFTRSLTRRIPIKNKKRILKGCISADFTVPPTITEHPDIGAFSNFSRLGVRLSIGDAAGYDTACPTRCWQNSRTI